MSAMQKPINSLSKTYTEISQLWLYAGLALDIQMVGEFLLKSKIGRPKLKYLVRNRRLRRLFSPWRLREFHALYPPSAGPGYMNTCFKCGELTLVSFA
jgi:hypothetical protein